MDSAGIPWYSTGTVNVTQGSSNVAGVGTNWVNAGLKVGDIFTIDKSRLYQITEIKSNTLLTLQEAYQGATGTSQVYFVIRNFAGTMQAQIAAQVSELVNKYESYIDTELKQITGPAGPTSFPYRGTWVTGRSYNGLDVVQYGNQLYMALYGHTSTSANAPGASETAWEQLTFDAAFPATKAEIAAVANAGAKNILPMSQSAVINGITFDVQSDGTIKLNGTASKQAVYIISTFQSLDGTYTLSGCPIGGNATNEYMLFTRKNPYSASNPVYRDIGNGVNVTYEPNTEYIVAINVVAGVTLNNVIFKPMLCNAVIEDGTYVPYAKTNWELTRDTQDIVDSGWILADNDVVSCSYRKKNGVVYVKANNKLKKNILPNVFTPIFTLPVGCIPNTQLFFIATTSSLDFSGFVRVNTSGVIDMRPSLEIPSNITLVLDIVFPV